MMKKMPSKDKKIRGKKKKYLSVERWREANEKIDFESLESFGAHYARLDIKPWINYYRTGPNTFSYRNPLGKFQNYILKGLIEIYDSWHQQLISRQGLYDLKIRIYLPNFIYSSVGASHHDVTIENENGLVESNIEFPLQMYPGLQKELGRFEFKSFFQDEIYYESEMGLCQFWGYRRLLSKKEMLKEMVELGAVKENVKFKNEEEDIKYTVRRGILWIGIT